MRKHGIIAIGLLLMLGCNQKGPMTSSTPGRVPTPVETGTVTIQPVGTATPAFSTSPTPAASGSATPVASASPVAKVTPPGKPLKDALTPLQNDSGRFPVLTQKETVRMQTSAGDVTIEIYPEAAPNAVQRFKELIESGFYDETPVSRVVKQPSPFVAQFGINWRQPHNAWEKKEFKDDPTYFKLDRGTLCFAKAGIDHNSTQVFINYANNDRLATPEYNFTVFGKVVKGMEVVDSFAQVGDASGGLDQMRLWMDGGNYLESLTDKPTMIEKMTVVKP